MTRRIFEFIDDDRNGLIDGREITDFMRMLNKKALEEFESILTSLDENHR